MYLLEDRFSGIRIPRTSGKTKKRKSVAVPLDVTGILVMKVPSQSDVTS